MIRNTVKTILHFYQIVFNYYYYIFTCKFNIKTLKKRFNES